MSPLDMFSYCAASPMRKMVDLLNWIFFLCSQPFGNFTAHLIKKIAQCNFGVQNCQLTRIKLQKQVQSYEFSHATGGRPGQSVPLWV